jgi:hypothetical protein
VLVFSSERWNGWYKCWNTVLTLWDFGFSRRRVWRWLLRRVATSHRPDDGGKQAPLKRRSTSTSLRSNPEDSRLYRLTVSSKNGKVNSTYFPERFLSYFSYTIGPVLHVLSSLFISRGCVHGNRVFNRKDANRKLLDTVIYLTFVTKFSFSFPIWHIYIHKETTYIELKQFITKSGHKKSRDVNRNDIYRKEGWLYFKYKSLVGDVIFCRYYVAQSKIICSWLIHHVRSN